MTGGDLGSQGDEISGAEFVRLVSEFLTTIQTDLVSTKITSFALMLSFSKVGSHVQKLIFNSFGDFVLNLFSEMYFLF